MTTHIDMITARRMIEAHYHADEPLLLIGRPGEGKTALYEAVCREMKIGYTDFRFPQRDVADIAGMRVPDEKTGMMKHYLPAEMPVNEKIHGKRGILVCEEINAVGPMLQAVGYGIINERRCGTTKLLPGWVPMGAGNHHTHGAAAQRITTALANRFCVKYVQQDVAGWLEQYGSEHADTRGCAFLRFRPELFSLMPGESATNAQGVTTISLAKDAIEFPSARSWTKAFKFIDSPDRFQHFCGYVGEGPAREFEAFWKIMSAAISIDEIVAGPKTARLPSEADPGTYYAVCAMVARLMDRKNIGKLAAYVERLMADYQVAIFQDATKRKPDLKNTSEYGSFAVRNAELLT